MARGFESKDVEFQQAEAERSRQETKVASAAERDAHAVRGGLALALASARADRTAASNPRHREMLDAAIRALEAEIAAQQK